jgi:lysozyme
VFTTDRAPGDHRRLHWPVGLIAGLVILTVLAAGLWFVFLPNWRPPLQDGERYGVDVSNHQGTVDWDLVAADGIEFAYIKASEGQGWVDASFERNWTEAERAGLDRGVYHFFTLCAPGEAQARNFLAVAPPVSNALPPAVDLEFPGNCSQRPPAAEVAAEVDRFVEVVEQEWGREVILYVDHRWESQYPVKERLGREIWQLRVLRRPAEDWFVWQIHGFADVAGVTGRVDLNIMRGGS